ncbi:MAG: AmmeMemoRadiSam system protein B [Bryobacteraceae bacterium]
MLPRLRAGLDFIPSPFPDKPGLVIRDPFQFSDVTLIIPPPLVSCLTFYDGEQSSLDLRAHLTRATGSLESGDVEAHLTEALSNAGFLEDQNFAERRAEAEKAFAEAPHREPAHSGSGYPDEPVELRKTFAEYLTGPAPEPRAGKLRAIAAPHVSPFGGIDAYRAAYSCLTPEDADRTVVILGTSHYGYPSRWGLTRKPFHTPYGVTRPATELIDEIERKAPDSVLMEDYCHAIEHSIEFQVVFLQHLLGPDIRVLPILCGSFFRSIEQGGLPEDDPIVERALGTLGEIAAREGDKLLWVLGVDMAHIGRRYGDPLSVSAGRGEMTEVEQRDRERIDRLSAGDVQGYWERIQENQDDLKWCGSAPIYTFLRALPEVRGELMHYQQWNIDPESVVSFAGMRFLSR